MLSHVCFIILAFLTISVTSQSLWRFQPAHYYGANAVNIRSEVVPKPDFQPAMRDGTLAPHVCGFNSFTRRCMDPEGICPGRCMNFRYTYNVLYDCRCLAVK